MLRGRLPDDVAMYPDVTDGLNLRASLEDLKPTEAERKRIVGKIFLCKNLFASSRSPR